jgi:hypothetical protein
VAGVVAVGGEGVDEVVADLPGAGNAPFRRHLKDFWIFKNYFLIIQNLKKSFFINVLKLFRPGCQTVFTKPDLIFNSLN